MSISHKKVCHAEPATYVRQPMPPICSRQAAWSLIGFGYSILLLRCSVDLSLVGRWLIIYNYPPRKIQFLVILWNRSYLTKISNMSYTRIYYICPTITMNNTIVYKLNHLSDFAFTQFILKERFVINYWVFLYVIYYEKSITV